MSDIWMGISPERQVTRVLAMAGPSETILKARLRPSPTHPRAMATLLERSPCGKERRSALWSVWTTGMGRTTRFYREVFTDFGGPLYTLDWVPACRGVRRRHRDLPGVGVFTDLRQQVLFEVAR